MSPAPLRIGISRCLLEVACRYDGGRGRLPAAPEEPAVTWVSVCPERDLGMGVPREAVRLVGRAGEERMLGECSGDDWTARMEAFASGWLEREARFGLHGFVLQSRSPSCGLGSTWRFATLDSDPVRDGIGVFARVLHCRLPGLPLVEDAGLTDAAAWEAFFRAARAYASL